MKNKYYFLILTFLFYSCSPILFREGLSIDEKSDWFQAGRNEAKTNISDSSLILNPPFKELWNYGTEAAFSKNAMSVSNGVLFASCLNGNVYAINIYTGSGLGKVSTKSKSSSSNPVILKNIVILVFSDGVKNYITGYDFRTGKFKWQKPTGEILSSPVAKNNKIFYGTTKGQICKVDSETGKREWNRKNEFSFHTSPSICNDLLLIGDIKGNLLALDIGNGNIIWKFKTNGGIYSDVSVDKDKIFFGSDDNCFYCLDTNGTLIWKKNLGTKFLSSCTFYNDNVICTGVNGKIYSLKENSGEINWEYETRGTISASPVLNRDKIYIGSYDRFFYCLDANRGEVLWKYELDERIKTTAVIWKNYLIVANDDKSIYCFK